MNAATARAYVGLGANLGNARATLEAAWSDLGALRQTRRVARSGLWRTAPVDSSGPDYLNAVASLDTALDPWQLLAALQAIERRHGRERPYRNAPRTLDLDLLLHGDRTIASADLTVPHPRMHERAFVLRPLLELDPGIVIPGRGPALTWLPGVAGQAIAPDEPR